MRNILKRGHQYLEQFTHRAKAGVSTSEVVHFNETGMRVVESFHWFRVTSTDSITCYFIHPQRRTPAMSDIGILDGFDGYAVHDHFPSYYQLYLYYVACNANQLRELIYSYEELQQWAQKMISCLLEAKAEVDLAVERGQAVLSDERVIYYDTRYSTIV